MILLIATASFLATPVTGLNADRHLGDSTNANLAAMIVPPPPRGPFIEGTDGAAAVAAVRRMQAGKIKELMNTTISPVLVWKP